MKVEKSDIRKKERRFASYQYPQLRVKRMGASASVLESVIESVIEPVSGWVGGWVSEQASESVSE